MGCFVIMGGRNACQGFAFRQSAQLDLSYHWWENLFFTIKHREVEGAFSPVDASEIRNYLEGLMYDD